MVVVMVLVDVCVSDNGGRVVTDVLFITIVDNDSSVYSRDIGNGGCRGGGCGCGGGMRDRRGVTNG